MNTAVSTVAVDVYVGFQGGTPVKVNPAAYVGTISISKPCFGFLCFSVRFELPTDYLVVSQLDWTNVAVYITPTGKPYTSAVFKVCPSYDFFFTLLLLVGKNSRNTIGNNLFCCCCQCHYSYQSF